MAKELSEPPIRAETKALWLVVWSLIGALEYKDPGLAGEISEWLEDLMDDGLPAPVSGYLEMYRQKIAALRDPTDEREQ